MNLQITLIGGPADLTRHTVNGSWPNEFYVQTFEPTDFPVTTGDPIKPGSRIKLRQARYDIHEIAPRVLVGLYTGDV